jgi:hypothetical protein
LGPNRPLRRGVSGSSTLSLRPRAQRERVSTLQTASPPLRRQSFPHWGRAGIQAGPEDIHREHLGLELLFVGMHLDALQARRLLLDRDVGPGRTRPPRRMRGRTGGDALLWAATGTALSMLCTGEAASRSPWATLLAPSLPQDDLVSHPLQDGGGRHDARDTAAKPTLGALLQQGIECCRTDPASAAHMRQWLLAGSQRHPDPVASVDHLLTELGLPLLPIVTSEVASTC